MQITIFGASGKVGRLAVDEALRRGYSVVAVTHSTPLSGLGYDNNRFALKQADVHDEQAVADSLRQSQVVISALSSWGTASKDIMSSGMRSIIPAMQALKITRIISLTGTEAYDKDDDPAFVNQLAHTLARLAARKILIDGEDHIRLLRASGLAWTVLRSPVMTNRLATGYWLSTSPKPPWQTITRRAVAKALVDQVEKTEFLQIAPFIYQS